MNEEILKELREIKAILSFQKEIWTLEEFCNYTGYSPAHVYHLTSKGKIEFSRPTGKIIFFEKEKVIEFLKKNPVVAKQQLEDFARKQLLKKLK
jgi:excisionase family DNA binding protein